MLRKDPALAPVEIQRDDPRAADVLELLRVHLDFSHGVTPREFSFAMDSDELIEAGVHLYTARRDGALLGMGALKPLDPSHAEIKSMHVRASVRGQGIGRAILDHLLHAARHQGFRRVSLETGTVAEYAAARAPYAGAGFEPCPPFGDYAETPYNACMTLLL